MVKCWPGITSFHKGVFINSSNELEVEANGYIAEGGEVLGFDVLYQHLQIVCTYVCGHVCVQR